MTPRKIFARFEHPFGACAASLMCFLASNGPLMSQPLPTTPSAELKAPEIVLPPSGEESMGQVLLSANGYAYGFTFELNYSPEVAEVVDIEMIPKSMFRRSRLLEGGLTVEFVARYPWRGEATSLPPNTGMPVVSLTFRRTPSTQIGESTPLSFSESFGVGNLVVVVHAHVQPELTDGFLIVAEPILFVRGDVNNDGAVDVGDPIALVMYLFGSGEGPPCADAVDANDDGRADIADPIYILRYLFSAGDPPPAPFPVPGRDPTPDGKLCFR